MLEGGHLGLRDLQQLGDLALLELAGFQQLVDGQGQAVFVCRSAASGRSRSAKTLIVPRLISVSMVWFMVFLYPSNHSLEVFHDDEKLPGIGWTGIEIEMLIEALRVVVLGGDEQRPDAGDVGRRSGALQRILE